VNIYNIYSVWEDSYKNHQMVKEIFPGIGKLLFQKVGSRLVVVTDLNIDPKFMDRFEIEFQTTTEEYLSNISGDIQFSIRINAVKSNKKKRFPIYRTELPEWINQKLSVIGADIRSKAIVDEGTIVSDRNGIKCFHSSVLVIGFLNIIDIDIFSNVVHTGIGHGKAFGFGLMNIFR
jgi:CRISPR system Cascade subunit CasE